MRRRSVLAGLMAAALAPRATWAEEPGLTLGDAQPFSVEGLIDRARRMAGAPHRPRPQIPQAWHEISYDQYRMIWFDGRNALWRGGQAPLQVDLFPPGLFYRRPVGISVVEDGKTRPVLFDLDVFDTTDRFPDLPVDETLGYSGLRLRAEIEKPGIFQEFAVFQGASYFRGIGTGQIYGLSARGLAIDTAEPSGEEFPEFTDFWIERPADAARETVIHGLLDSPRATGLYSFRIRPGAVLEMDVTAHLFARQPLSHVGLGPLTSMFLFDETIRDRFSDFRPAVHDSDGLLIHNGAGETIWRPLSNPRQLQISAFVDDGPQGFGLMQRARGFSDFADLEALYHRRPSLWVTPDADWGRGAVTLVEIPADREIFDNIVAYWRPSEPILPGAEWRFGYRLSWGDDPAPPRGLAQVTNTRMGRHMQTQDWIITVDFAPHPDLEGDLSGVELVTRSSAGQVSGGVLQRNPDTGGARLAVTFTPGTTTLAELRVQLRAPDRPLSEVWLYRWTA